METPQNRHLALQLISGGSQNRVMFFGYIPPDRGRVFWPLEHSAIGQKYDLWINPNCFQTKILAVVHGTPKARPIRVKVMFLGNNMTILARQIKRITWRSKAGG